MSKASVVTVVFDRPVAGRDLVSEVRRLAADYGTSFQSSPSPDGFGVLVGQAGDFYVDHLLVAPASGGYGIVPDQAYERIVVMSHPWPEQPPRFSPPDWRRLMVEHALIVFARRLCKSIGVYVNADLHASINCEGEEVATFFE